MKLNLPLGAFINAVAIILGTIVGFFAQQIITPELQDLLLPLMGLLTLCLGAQTFMRCDDVLIIAVALVAGAAVGHGLDIQGGFEHFAEWVKAETTAWFPAGGNFVQAALTASLLFVIGPMAILGSLEDGLENRRTILNIKSVLDGVTSAMFTAAMGMGVIVSAIAVFIYQGLITLFANQLAFLRNDVVMLNNMSGMGGVLLLGIGLNVIGITHLPMGNVLPAFILLPLFLQLERKIRNYLGRSRPKPSV